MLIYLVGLPASGKSTIGKQLAKMLKYQFVDLDHLIERKEGDSIPHIFKTKGEAYFRNLEKEVLEISTELDDTVVATGGGTPCYFDNMDVILESGISFYLDTPNHTIAKRIQQKQATRPMFQNQSFEEIEATVQHLFIERQAFYVKAHHTIKEATQSDAIQAILDIIG